MDICKILSIATRCLILSILGFSQLSSAETKLADKPLFTSYSVPGNVALTLSVEWPTALSSAYTGSNDYNPNITFYGYFDDAKCYDYHLGATTNKHYFKPASFTSNHLCSGKWSGNFLNWALTQTIDPFRQTLTGGYRSIDELDLTVLEKAWHTGQGNNPIKTLNGASKVSGATPFNWPNLSLKINGQGNTLVFTNNTDNLNVGYTNVFNEVPDDNSNGNLVYRAFARVQVCASEALKEKNCTVYPNGRLKPTGLIQKNATKMNFAAFGYANDSTSPNQRDGGVLRAKMAPLGPKISQPGSADIVNPNPEWNEDTGIFITNPDEISASASGVSNSGVINYLNKFGISGSYKSYDPASELYYTAIRYFKKQGNISAYTNNLSTQAKDGFPIITSWNDPIKYSCQTNFIIGVGDINTWADSNLPGSTVHGEKEPSIPPEVNADSTVDVTKSTNRVSQMQGLGNLGSSLRNGSAMGGTYYIAGLAYDAHTVDMRKDIPNSQTLKTYWLDVLETGFSPNNQYWLAAKYGGFDVPAGYQPYSNTVTPLTSTQWQTNQLGDPHNYFRANNPKLMQENLSKAFDDILLNITKSSSALAVTNQNIDDGDMAYTSAYKVDGWSGDISAKKTIVDTSTGLVSALTTVWSASDKLESRTTPRIIATAKCSSSGTTQQCTGIPFQMSELNTSGDNTYLAGLTDASGASIDASNVLDYLRGKKTVINNNRKKILGDITAPQPIVVGAPNAGYSDATNPGYSAFKEKYKARGSVIYSGANDGMLHAFAGGATGGEELFAYVPQALFKGPSSPATPNENGLAALAKDGYVHHAYVDKTPIVQDVNFGENDKDWHSILVGGLGKGGKAYYALDVTDPSGFTNESKLASKVLWEFKHPNLGYSYCTPLIVKTKKDGWVVILTSGYNNADGKGHFFIIKAKDGSLIQDVATSGSTNSDGLAHVSAFINSLSDNTADAAYAGDLQGNLWRLDLSKTTANNLYESPALIAQFKSSTGQAQPITTPPALALDGYTGKRFVFVGTGRLLDDSDISSTQEQSFYAVLDGTRQKFYDAPASPITRANMADNTEVNGLNLSSTQIGWFIDLGLGSNGNAYRVNAPITVSAGVVSFAKNLPDNSDVCNPSGNAEGFGIHYSTGKTALPAGKKHVHIDGLVNLINFYNSAPFDKGVVISFNADGSTTGAATDACPNNQCRTVSPANNFKVLNWREVNAE